MGIYGLQLFNNGNIMLDTTDSTARETGLYSNASITANGDITGVTIPAGAVVSIVNNNGEGDLAQLVPDVILEPINNRIRVQNGGSGFSIGLHLVMLE